LIYLKEQFDLERVLNTLKQEKIIAPNLDWPDIEFYRPGESKECPDGYKGRVGIYEVLEVSQSIKDLITREATTDAIEVQAKKEGMFTMLEDGFVKAVQGMTSIEEVLRVTKE